VRVREPLGERVLAEGMTVGGAGSALVVPGAHDAELVLERRGGVGVAAPVTESVRINGDPLTLERDLTRDELLTVAASGSQRP
jgi:hypothetical protein